MMTRRQLLKAAGAMGVGVGLLGGGMAARGASPMAERVRDAMRRATAGIRSLATEGGYLWWYSADLRERWGEGKATPTQIWVQPPGTPSVGMVFLRAYAATGDKKYLDAAKAAALALVRGQLESGGWDYLIDFDPDRSRRWYRRADKGQLSETEASKRRNTTTFDDDNTQSALRFLMAFVVAVGDGGDAQVRVIRDGLEYGLRRMLEAQYPNGAWPQRYDGRPRDPARYPVRRARIPERYPREWPKQNYGAYYTLNDNTQRDCILTMVEAYRRLGERAYLDGARKGGDFLILAQLPAPQSAWAQQYNFEMEPAWARAFEPPALCAAESAGVVRTLVDLYRVSGEEKYLKPIPAAVEWFRRSEIGPNVWARFYELGTNRPIYGDRDGKIHYELNEISEERRRGYSWRGAYGIATAIAYYDRAREKRLDSAEAGGAAMEGGRRPVSEDEAASIVKRLDAEGRWVTNGRIEMRVFIRNMGMLCAYLEQAVGA